MVLFAQLEHPSCDAENLWQVGEPIVVELKGTRRQLNAKDVDMRLVERLFYSQSSSIKDIIGRARCPQNY